MRYTVTIREEVEAVDAKDAATQVDRLLHTYRPVVMSVTTPGPDSKTSFIKVDRGEATKVA